MLKVVEPKEYCYYRGRVDLFVELMKLQQPVSLSDAERELSTFIIGQKEDGHIYGGAILQHQHVSELNAQIESVISTVIPNQQHVWTGTFSLCENQVTCGEEGRLFYKNLLRGFSEFCREKNSRFLCLSLSPEEYLRTKEQEGWSYVLEITPQETSGEFFHGILSLSDGTGKKNTAARKLFATAPLSKKLAA